MDKTKSAIRDFMGRSGHHETTIHQSVDPAVKHETVKPTQHEDVNTAIDREVHQDHYHRTVQPVQDKEILPEQHTHSVAGVEQREFDYRDNERTKQTLTAEGAKFKDERRVNDTTYTQSHAPTVEGEHVHHHLHETIQPVIHKETIQPSVVHTTVPVHEVHHNAAQHHGTAALPALSMDEFKKQGGVLGGRGERVDVLEGELASIPETLARTHKKKDSGFETGAMEAKQKGVHHGDFDPMDNSKAHRSTANVVGAGMGQEASKSTTTSAAALAAKHPQGARPVGARRSLSSSSEDDYEVASGGAGAATRKDTPRQQGQATAAAKHAMGKSEPTLINKLNPMTDTTGDGRAGFMQ